MKNYIQDGTTIEIEAPTGGLESGDIYELEDDNETGYISIVKDDVDAGDTAVLQVEGVHELPQADGVSFSAGDQCYADDGDITDSSTGNVYAGRVWKDTTTGDDTVWVKINQR